MSFSRGTQLLKKGVQCSLWRSPLNTRTLASCGLGGSRAFDKLFHNNETWRESMTAMDPNFFARQADSQHPTFLWIGCSDSRVPAEAICGVPPGTFFVHRNIANVISNTDVSALSVIQFAVDVLEVQHIVICGHYGCGGIAAAMENVDHKSPLENWLRNIRDVCRLHHDELYSIRGRKERIDRLVEINVIEQAINLYKTRVVQRQRVKTFENLDKYGFVQPQVHPVVYDPATGKLLHLAVRMQEILKKLRPIYTLYDTEHGDAFDGVELTQQLHQP